MKLEDKRSPRWTVAFDIYNTISQKYCHWVITLMYKYPRTPHIEGSRLQPGDEDLDSVPFSVIASQYVVVEEKVETKKV
jgi:hypothetical protein